MYKVQSVEEFQASGLSLEQATEVYNRLSELMKSLKDLADKRFRGKLGCLRDEDDSLAELPTLEAKLNEARRRLHPDKIPCEAFQDPEAYEFEEKVRTVAMAWFNDWCKTRKESYLAIAS